MKQMLSPCYLLLGLWALALPVHAQISYLDTMDTQLQSFKLLSASSNRTDNPPVVDGVLDDEAWKTATSLGNFKNTVWRDAKKPDWQKTTAWVTHDDRYLYFAFSCDENDMSKVRAEAFRQDHADVLYDDRIEIYLDPFHNHKELLRVAFNTKGIGYATTIERPVQYSVSVIRGDDRWNTEWRVKTKLEDNRWTAEVAIALDRIFPEPITPGTTWGLNLIRDRHARHDYTSRHGDWVKGPFLTPDTQQITAWKPVFSGGPKTWSFIDMWLEPNQFGDLRFDQGEFSVKEMLFHEAYANFYGNVWNKPQFFGNNPLEAVLQNSSGMPLDLILQTETVDFKGHTAVIEKPVQLAAGQTKTFASEIPVRVNERVPFTFTVLNQADGQQLFQSSYDTRVPPFVEFDLSGVYSAGKDNPTIEVSPVVIPANLVGTTLTLELYRRGESQPMATDRLTNLQPYDFVPCLEEVDLAALPTDDYTIDCALLDASGNVIGKFTQPFTRHNTVRYPGLSVEKTVYSYAGAEGDATIVYFKEGERFVFWEHASYVPWWDLNNMAVTYEFMETWGYGTEGCAEPMQDKENRYSKVDIIENTPARVVVLWRYALGDPNYKIAHNHWVHEYYYFYPDGSGVREIMLWATIDDVKHEIMQPQYIFPTGVIPEQMFEEIACTVFNLNGDILINKLEEPLWEIPDSAKAWDEEIMRIYLKNRKHPYLVWSKREDMMPDTLNEGLARGDVKRTMGGHWPLQPMNVDVYSVVGTDRPYHAWFGNVHVYSDSNKIPNHWKHLIGLASSDNEHLINIGQNWLNPPELIVTTEGVTSVDYDENQKAYLLQGTAETTSIDFSFTGKEANLVNPVLIVQGLVRAVKSVRVGDRFLDAESFKSAPASRFNAAEMVIWIGEEVSGETPVSIEFMTEMASQ